MAGADAGNAGVLLARLPAPATLGRSHRQGIAMTYPEHAACHEVAQKAMRVTTLLLCSDLVVLPGMNPPPLALRGFLLHAVRRLMPTWASGRMSSRPSRRSAT